MKRALLVITALALMTSVAYASEAKDRLWIHEEGFCGTGANVYVLNLSDRTIVAKVKRRFAVGDNTSIWEVTIAPESRTSVGCTWVFGNYAYYSIVSAKYVD